MHDFGTDIQVKPSRASVHCIVDRDLRAILWSGIMHHSSSMRSVSTARPRHLIRIDDMVPAPVMRRKGCRRRRHPCGLSQGWAFGAFPTKGVMIPAHPSPLSMPGRSPVRSPPGSPPAPMDRRPLDHSQGRCHRGQPADFCGVVTGELVVGDDQGGAARDRGEQAGGDHAEVREGRPTPGPV